MGSDALHHVRWTEAEEAHVIGPFVPIATMKWLILVDVTPTLQENLGSLGARFEKMEKIIIIIFCRLSSRETRSLSDTMIK